MYTPDIQKPNVLSVSQVTSFIKSLIEGEPILRTVFLSGEISNLGRYPSGFYFSLKDSNSVISAVMFKYQAQRLRFEPKNGDKVKVSIRFRGRQITHQEIGLSVMQDFAERVKDIASVERKPMVEGRHMIMILAPRDLAKEAKAAKAANKEAPAASAE